MERVKARFVPVTLNADRLPAGPDGDFFRTLLKRWPQGLWVVTPAGETLGFHYHTPKPGDTFKQNNARWVADTAAMLDYAWQQAGELPPREPRPVDPYPDRGRDFAADGGVRLAVSVTETRGGAPYNAPVFDSFRLSAGGLAEFAPKPGADSVEVSEAAARRFAPVLSPLTDSIFCPRPADLTVATIRGTVLRREQGQVVVSYAGEWQSKHLRDGKADQPVTASLRGGGIATLSADGTRVRRMLWVLSGSYQKGPGVAAVPTAAVVEWSELGSRSSERGSEDKAGDK